MSEENFDNALPNPTPEQEDWETKFKALEKQIEENKEEVVEEDEPKPVTSGMRSHAHSTDQQLAVSGLDPNKEYRFVSKQDPKLKYLNTAAVNQRITRKYTVVSDPENKIQGPRMMGGSNIETHDLILMETSKENHKKQMMMGPARAASRMKAVREAHESGELEGKIATKKKTYASSLNMLNESDTIFEI